MQIISRDDLHEVTLIDSLRFRRSRRRTDTSRQPRSGSHPRPSGVPHLEPRHMDLMVRQVNSIPEWSNPYVEVADRWLRLVVLRDVAHGTAPATMWSRGSPRRVPTGRAGTVCGAVMDRRACPGRRQDAAVLVRGGRTPPGLVTRRWLPLPSRGCGAARRGARRPPTRGPSRRT